MIQFTETDPNIDVVPFEPEWCECRGPYDCTLSIEEGQASLLHDACGHALWLEQEDIFAEFQVKVTVETCTDQWHGMQRCECGPEVEIELSHHDPEVQP